SEPSTIQLFLQIKWTGLLLLPAAYLHFSGELLTLTGRPSRGRRRRVEILIYAVSLIGALLVWAGVIVGGLAPTRQPMPYLVRNDVTFGFGIYYLVVMAMASYNLVRAYLRGKTATTKRRLLYLLAGAAAPALSAIIFMFHGNAFFAQHPDVFWIVSSVGAGLTVLFIILMAYVVSFYGVTWTDRIIRNRLFRWLLRGPFVAAITLGATTAVRRVGATFGNPYIAYVPMVMVGAIIVLEFLINIFSPKIEKWLFRDGEQEDLNIIQTLDERMLTIKDLHQFLETVAASVCDRLQVPQCTIGILDSGKMTQVIVTGEKHARTNIKIDQGVIDLVQANLNSSEGFIELEGVGYLPLMVIDGLEKAVGKEELVGILAAPLPKAEMVDDEQMESISLLAERAALAIKDRQVQQQILKSITSLQVEVDLIQEMRATASVEPFFNLQVPNRVLQADFVDWVRDGLTHYWGGPKLTNSPLLELKIVQKYSLDLDGNRTNGLRSVLKECIERTKPQGERKYTGDWLLYNLLDMKYIQGRKVRDVAHKLAISEADLYRKQRVAIEAVALNIMEMENASDISGALKKEPSDTVS
ncbi:MAG TPA: hypothetical protein VLR89_00875, partial [Anaerolineaceae bacterium]|nr:hypothetical protein [Anaerolineaceae bacterium]